MDNKIFNNMSDVEKEIIIMDYFSSLTDIISKEDIHSKNFLHTDFKIKNTLKILIANNILISRIIEYQNNNEDFLKCKQKYNSILDKWLQLAHEMKLNNSLQISNMFSYLLWNGYFSKLNNHKYNIDNRRNIIGFFAFDILNGSGVCLNYSDMLKDLLNRGGYQASSIINYVDGNININYKPELKTETINPKIYTRLLMKMLTPLKRIIGDHACVLINENNKSYIYDATNILILKVQDINTAVIINGNGKFKLKPKLSYTFVSKSEKEVIRKFVKSKNFDSPYNGLDFIDSWEICMELFNNNKSIINDCYDSTKNDIDNIVNSMKNINTKVKTKDLF